MQAQALEDFDRLWNYSKPAETEKKFRELLPKAVEANDASYRLQLLTQIARTLGLQGKFKEAHAILDEVEKELTDELALARVRYLLERGRAHRSSKHPDKARPLFLQAWESGTKAKEDFHAVDAAHMMALVCTSKEEKLAWNLKAMAFAEKSGDRRAKNWLGALYNNMGWDYRDQGDYEKALELHRKCLKWHEERKTGRGLLIARYSVGTQLRYLKRFEEALKIQRALLEEWRKLGEPAGYVNEEIAECLHALGKVEDSRPYFAKAYEILSKDTWHLENEPERIERLKQLSGK
jgi:tetratricopeptide (TPR) repeat protein